MAGASMDGVRSLKKTIDSVNERWFTGTVRATAFADTSYDVYVEYGTWKMEAQPYMRPAAERGARQAKSSIDGSESAGEVANAIATQVALEARRLVPVDTGYLKSTITVNHAEGSASASI